MNTPRIIHHPGRMFGSATIGESRLSAAMIADAWWEGMEFEDIHQSWFDRDGWRDEDTERQETRRKVLVCCWWAGEHSRSRTQRRRFHDWVEQYAADALWSVKTIDSCPDPPTKDTD